MTAARSCPCCFAPIHLQPYAPVLPLLCDECMIFVPHRPNAVVCTRVRESSLWAAVVTAIRFLDGHPSSPEPPAPVPPVTNLSTPAVRVGVGAVVRRAGDSSILVGVRCGSHGAGYSPFFLRSWWLHCFPVVHFFLSKWALPGGHLEVHSSTVAFVGVLPLSFA